MELSLTIHHTQRKHRKTIPLTQSPQQCAMCMHAFKIKNFVDCGADHRVHIFTRDETGSEYLPTQLERTLQLYR
jgi:hypothetical protein